MFTPDLYFLTTHVFFLFGWYSKIDQENLLQKVVEWQGNYPHDHFLYMPATESAPTNDVDILRRVECKEQVDEDEVFPQMQKMEKTEFLLLPPD